MNTLTKCCHCGHLQMIDANPGGMEYTCEGCGKQAIYDDGTARRDDGQEREPCPYCRELVLKGVRKCRFCGEYVDEELRESRGALSKGDVVLAVLWPLGVLMGLQYAWDGKRKGWRLVRLSLFVALMGAGLRILLKSLS